MTTQRDARLGSSATSVLRRGRPLGFLALATAVITLAGLTAVDAPAAHAQTSPVPAQAADDFIQSIGVATHLTYHGTPYLNYDLVAQRLRESGIKHLRDGWGTGSAYASDFVRETLGPMGVKITMVHDPRNNATPAEHKEMVKSQLLPVIAGAESLNEWDTKGAGWATYARDWTIAMSRAYRSDPATADIPLLGPSMADTNNAESHRAMGDLGPFVDVGNTHDYPGNQYHMNDSIMDVVQRNVGAMVGNKPIHATETGFSNGPVHAPYPAMPEQQVAVSLPKLYLDHFRRGIARSFSYELFDQYPNDEFESRFGLLRHDGTPKPAFHAVASLTKLLSDPGPRFSPRSLSYGLTGGDAATRQLLLQKRDGTFWLAVWQQSPVWDGSRVLDPPDRQVTLQLADAVNAGVHVLGASAGTPRATHSNVTTVPLTSSEQVTLVELTPGSGPVPAPAPAQPAPGDQTRVQLCSSSNTCWDSASVSTGSEKTGPAAIDVSYLTGDVLCLRVGGEHTPAGATCTRARAAAGDEGEQAFLSTVEQLGGPEALAVAAAWFAL